MTNLKEVSAVNSHAVMAAVLIDYEHENRRLRLALDDLAFVVKSGATLNSLDMKQALYLADVALREPPVKNY